MLELVIHDSQGLPRASLRFPDAPMRLKDLAEKLLALAEAVASWSTQRSLDQGEKISCRKGCGACCRQPVPVSPAEGFWIKDLIAGLPARKRAAVTRRFRSAAALLDGQPWLEAPFHHAPDYFRLGIPCPFLERESCSIHRQRPAACRAQLAVSPAHFCAEFPHPFIRVLPMDLSIHALLSELCGELLGTAPMSIPLVRALEWAEMHAEEDARTWDGRRLLERIADKVNGSPRLGRAGLAASAKLF